MQLILPRIGRAVGPFPRTCFNAHIVSVRVLPLLRDAFSQTSPTGVDLLNDSKPTFYYRITQLSCYAMHEQKIEALGERKPPSKQASSVEHECILASYTVYFFVT